MPNYKYLKPSWTVEQIEDSLRLIESPVGNNQLEVIAFDPVIADNGKFTQIEVKERSMSNGPLPELWVKTIPSGPATIDDYADDGIIIVDYADIYIKDVLVPTVIYRKELNFQPTAGYITLKGTISVFGGSRDQGVKPDEGLALITPKMINLPQFKDYFLDQQPPGTTGLARRLNNEGSHYIACRWNYQQTPPDFLRNSKVIVSYEAKEYQVQPVDWGPNAKTGRVADLSDKLADDLGVETDRELITIKIPIFGTTKHLDALALAPTADTPAASSGSPAQQRYNARTLANIASLAPDYGAKVQQWLDLCRQNDLNPLIHFGSRSPEEQMELYRKYLAGGPKTVQPKKSYHCYGRAIDWVHVSNADGGNRGLDWENSAAYKKGTELGIQLGLKGISGDSDHLQDAAFPAYSDLKQSEYGQYA